MELKHHVDISKMSVNDLRKRLFVKRSSALYGSDYTFVDDIPEQVETLEGFESWETFSETWDVYWVGLDPRTLKWIAGRHNSPMRKIVLPLRILKLDERTKRMMETHLDKKDVSELEVPFKEPLYESEEDRAISESLTGKVIIDEPDEDKAIRLIQQNMEQLQTQLALLMSNRKENGNNL